MSNVLSCDFDTLLRVVGPIMNENKPLLLRGKHGVGKSEVVYQMAERLFWDEKNKRTVYLSPEKTAPKGVILGYSVTERRISQMTEGDLIGLPVIQGNRTSFNPPDWYKEACEKPVLLFCDEVDRGTIEVRQGLFEMTDSRKLNGHKLHPGTIIVAAVNGGKYAAQYQVGEMDPAELDRWSVFDVEPTVEDWMNWAKLEKDGKRNIHSTIVDFLNTNRNHLEHIGEFEPHKKYPSRRSWKRANDVLDNGNYLNEHHKDIVILASAFVGMEAAVAIGDFVKNQKKIVMPTDILDKGLIDLTKMFNINEHSALISRMEQQNSLKDNLSDKQIGNLGKYYMTLPSECAAVLFKIMGDTSNMENIANLLSLEIDGVKIKMHFVKMMSNNPDLKDK